jgi:hypothetical protein
MSNFVGFASSASATVSVPAHANGDVLVAIAFRANNTAPSTPAGWTSLDGWGASSLGGRAIWRVSDGTVSTVTATNAECIGVWVFTSPDTTQIGAKLVEGATSRTIVRIPPLTLQDSDGSSWRVMAGVAVGSGLTLTEPGAQTVRATGDAGTMRFVYADEANVTTSPQRDFAISPGGTYLQSAYNIEVRLVPVAPPTPVADSLIFSTQPQNTVVGSTMAAFTVSAVDSTQSDAVDTDNTDNVTLLDPDSNYTGTKTKAAVAGVATFDDIVPLKILSATTLTADHATFADEVSAAFNITAPSGGGAPTFTEADMQYDLRARSATSQIGEVLILDDTGAPETGLVHNTSGLTCFASTDGGTAASVTLVDMTLGTYASGGFKQIDATNRPGWYAFGYPTLPTSGNRRAFTFKGTGLRPSTVIVDLGGADPREAPETSSEIADTLLGRSIAGGADGGRTVESALASLRNRVVISGGTMTVYDVDDTTPLWTGAITGTPAITESNPA